MSTVEDIEKHRSFRGGNINVLCAVCFRQAWTDYYGEYICKPCAYTFFTIISTRGTVACVYEDGECFGERKCCYCTFCGIKRYYKVDLKPTRFGKRENSCYMKDKELQSKQVLVLQKSVFKWPNFVFDNRPVHEWWHFVQTISLKKDLFRKWMRDNPPVQGIVSEEQMEYWFKLYGYRGAIMEIIVDSLHLPDVIKLGHSYFDPYFCRNVFIRRETMAILDDIRKIRAICKKGKITDEERKIYVYSILR